jgi:UDP-2-acetamido-3-amino-2,3-dideoxy-glucuronate N-acetyltransferase
MAKNIGMIGLGYWGKNILRNLHGLGLLHTACDSNTETLEQWQAKYENVQFTTSYDDLLKSPDIASIVIATPAITHFAVVKAALLAGKDVFVEKPLALTVKDGEDLVELAAANGRILMVGHILQYHPAIEKLKSMIAEGVLGKMLYIYSNRLNIGKLRTEENILWSFAPHDISIMLGLLEEEPSKVSAFGGHYISDGVFDTTMTTLEFNNGVKGHIFVSWLHPYKEQKLIVVGSEGMVVFDDMSEEKLRIHRHKIEWIDGKIPVAHKSEYEAVPLEEGEPLRTELLHFAECVRTRKTPRTDGREGVRVLKVLQAAEDSLLPAGTLSTSNKSYTVHESSYVDDDVNIGDGTRIWHFSHVLSRCRIGSDCVIGQNVSIGPDVIVGDRCKIQNNVSVYKGVTLEEEVFCGPSCVFTNVYNPRAFVERKDEFRPTLVGRGSTIGANATILCGSTIGRYALIGAGAVVREDVADHAIVVGVPARRVGWVCTCGTTLQFEGDGATCECGRTATQTSDAVAVSDL